MTDQPAPLAFMTAKEREDRLVLAASRGVYVALVQPKKHLGDAARAFDYRARTFEGDAFETAFEWARENMGRIDRQREEVAQAQRDTEHRQAQCDAERGS